MKQFDIKAAYDKAAPAPETEARIWARVVRAAEEPEERSAKRRPVLRRVLLAAACVALVAALAGFGYAAYEKWRLPEPQTYTPDPEGYNVQVHTEHTYTPGTAAPSLPDSTDPDETASAVTEPEPLSDEFFLLRAKEILAQAGIDANEDATVTVRRQKHLYWDREEVEVSWPHEGLPYSVTFDAENGVFIGMAGIDWVLDDVSACQTQAEADALARRYYESLPVEQGYVMAGCEKYDEQFWSYDFCREVEPGLYSWYECVRIAINPVSGGLELCRVFYVPLLDDHEPGDVPLTEEEAVDVLRANGFDPDSWDTVTVEKSVGLPNWTFTSQESSNLQASAVSRLCWTVVLFRDEDETTPFSTRTQVLVDCYTGEILGGDTTG